MREFLNKYGLAIAAGIVVLGLIIVYWEFKTVPPTTGNAALAFYIDEETGEETVGPSDQLPPLIGKAGRPTVVQEVRVTSDGGLTSQPFYYLKYTDEAKTQLEAIPPADPNKRNPSRDQLPDILEKGKQVRSAAPGSQWVAAMSVEGYALTARPDRPDGKPVDYMYPKK